MGKIRLGLLMGKMEPSEHGVGKAGSETVITLGKNRVQFGNKYRNSLKKLVKSRSGYKGPSKYGHKGVEMVKGRASCGCFCFFYTTF